MAELTNNIIAAKDNFTKHLYFKEDIESLIDKLIDCIKAKKEDTEQDVRANILRIFKYYDISCERNLTPEEYKQILNSSPIPSVNAFPEICWEKMLEFNLAYKTPQEYMKRLVDNLASPEFNSNEAPLRVKILRQFLGNMNYLQGTRLYSEELERIVEQDYKGVIADIDDEIFEKHLKARHIVKPHKIIMPILNVFGDVLYREGEQDDVLSALVSEFDSEVMGKTAPELVEYLKENSLVIAEDGSKVYPINEFDPELCVKIAEHLQTVLEKYSNTYNAKNQEIEEFQKIKNRVYQLEVITDYICANKLMKELITKEFRKVVNSQTEAWIKPEMPDSQVVEILLKKAAEKPRKIAKINDAILAFMKERLKENGLSLADRNNEFRTEKDRVKDRVKGIQLLHVCNNLAEGKFRKVAETKEILYLFAFAFDMSARPDKSQQDDFKYIRKNLFEDFYCDNIVRYIDHYEKVGVYEEPTGISLQYKNFVEVVYLYWLNKASSEIPPYQKYIEANKMIDKIIKRSRAAERIVDNPEKHDYSKRHNAKIIAKDKGKGTFTYRYYFEGVNDVIRKYGDYPSAGGILMDMSEKQLVKFILENYNVDTQKHYKGNAGREAFENQDFQEHAEKVFDNYINELSEDTFYQVVFFKSKANSAKTRNKNRTDEDKRLEAFENKINEQMKAFFTGIHTREDNNFTRTRLMYLYYEWFIREHIGGYTETFDSFCDEYLKELNEKLEICSYQLFSDKNLIDVMLLFAAFINLRIQY